MAVATLIKLEGDSIFKQIDFYFFEGHGNLQDRLYFYGSTAIIFLITVFILLGI